jgi:hypothetical protein
MNQTQHGGSDHKTGAVATGAPLLIRIERLGDLCQGEALIPIGSTACDRAIAGCLLEKTAQKKIVDSLRVAHGVVRYLCSFAYLRTDTFPWSRTSLEEALT